MSRFKWQSVETRHREERASIHGSELRWILNRETILDTETGSTMTRAVIRHPGICVIVPFLDEERIAVMQQYRYSVDRELWELPAGTLNGREEQGRMVATETPAECAARELLEETGLDAGKIELLTQCYAMPGSNDEIIYVFAARDLVQREQSLDIGEVISEIRGFSRDEIAKMIATGEICDAKTLVGLLLVLNLQPGVPQTS